MKKAIPALVVGLVLVIIVIVCGRLFMVGSIEVRFDTDSSITGESILSQSQVRLGDSIFGINENRVRTAIEDSYPMRNVEVVDIERVFPNRVVLYVHIREALFAIPALGGGYWLADADFQLNSKVSEGKIGNTIPVSGFTVSDTFRTTECEKLQNLANSLEEIGMTEEAMRAFFRSVEWKGDAFEADTVYGVRVIASDGYDEAALQALISAA